MKEGSETTIFLDKDKITSAISKDSEYQTDEVSIKRWDGGEDAESYLIEVNKKNLRFHGVLNKLFERNGYGIQIFENGEKYFGYFSAEKRNYNGIYFWPKEEENGRIKSEIYYGFWKDDHKNDNGIYVWLDEPTTDQNFDDANLEAYVGKFKDGTYSIGTYLQKTEDNYYLYYGNFTKDGLKNDQNGFFYSSNLDRLFHGEIINDVFVKGYIANFDSDSGTIESIVFANFEQNLKISNIVLEKDLNEAEKEKESKLCSIFRDVILGIDYFGELYKKIHDISEYVENNLDNVGIFNERNSFHFMIKLASSYSKNNIDKDINNKVFDNSI